MTGILIDLDGVLYEGEQPVAGAADAVGWLRRKEVPLLFLTNTTSRPRTAIAEKLAWIGVESDVNEILTPPIVAGHWLRRQALERVALFVPAATRSDFASFEVLGEAAEAGADAVVVGDLGEGWSFRTLNRAFRLLMSEPPPVLVALGMTRFWRAADGLRLDTAPFVAALAHAADVEPIVTGKPAQTFFEAATDRLGSTPGETLMIGDDIRTDIAASQALGMRGILVRTGKYRASDLDGVTPFAVLDSIAELPSWWQRREQADSPR